ncbi:ArsR/SmtB family transcription factor [Lentibacillus amyloliquefaciens]|uniref:ArsR family transcriptional regulator n=1 Tax=Lentibacillus amyloliquefaciens TaxID=1472767 RepID=A0A0U4EF25_9BACI|nr:metalloregulator ArsR/SmtB family transcription factor [Lentibacillus amyloliquefaciens]ALX49161.1 ArsR family transcriptional regulator [Lentibacillus amyloliquefaciens]
MTQDVCDVTCINEEKVNHVKHELNKQSIDTVIGLYKLLADRNRLQIASALLVEQELCVCDLANIIGATTATTSHHLRKLHKVGIATFRKEGKLVYYSLSDEHNMKQVITQGFLHGKEESVHVI